MIIYKIENNKFIKQFEMESSIFTNLTPINFKWIRSYYKFLFALKDKRIIIISSSSEMFLLEFPLVSLS